MPPFRPGRPPQGAAYAASAGVQPLPLVSVTGATNITNTGATLTGSINPQGVSGSWWFVYGTTPQFGSQTSSRAIAATTIPQAETVTVSALTANATYYFALVGQTVAGTVTSETLSFVAQLPPPPVDVTNLPTPPGVPAVSVPHWQYPIRFFVAGPGASLGVAAAEQDSLEEVFSDVQFVAACQQGACPELPTFGIPDPTFSQIPLDPSGIVAAIELWEPRATLDAVSQALGGPLGDPDSGNWQVGLTTNVAGSGS